MGYYTNLIGEENMKILSQYLFNLLFIVAAIDNKIDRKEKLAIDFFLLEGDFKNPITNEVFRFLKENMDRISSENEEKLRKGVTLEEIVERANRVTDAINTLKKSVGEERVKECFMEFAFLAMAVGNASGGSKGFLGFGKKEPLSEEEFLVIISFLQSLGISPMEFKNFVSNYYQ